MANEGHLLEEDGIDDEEDQHSGSGHEQGVEAIPQATMTGQDMPRVLDTRRTLDERLDEVAESGENADRERHAYPGETRETNTFVQADAEMTPDVSSVGEQQAQQHREDHAANQSLPGLLGRDAREELVRLHQLGAGHARQIGARVVDPDEEEEREDEDGAVVLPHVVHRERLGVERDERQQRHRPGDIDLSHDDECQFAQGIELVGIEAADEHQHHVDEIDDEDGRGRDVGCSQEGADEEHHAAETVDRTEDVALARHIDQREVLPKDAKGQYGKEDNKGVGTIEDGPDHQGYQQEARDGALNQTGNFHIDGGKRE